MYRCFTYVCIRMLLTRLVLAEDRIPHQIPENWSQRWLGVTRCVLWIKVGSSLRVSSVLNSWTIPPAPNFYHLLNHICQCRWRANLSLVVCDQHDPAHTHASWNTDQLTQRPSPSPHACQSHSELVSSCLALRILVLFSFLEQIQGKQIPPHQPATLF